MCFNFIIKYDLLFYNMDFELNNVFKFGVYYNPAWQHYNAPTNVVCDRCKRTNLPVCLGYDSLDLCMLCVHEMSKIKSQPTVPVRPLTRMSQDMYRTLMAQDTYRSFNNTYMMQDMYK